jgi:hypothetical protein
MKKVTYLSLLLICISLSVFAQFPGGGGGNNKGMGNINIARLYGKVLDSKTKQPVEFAAVALLWFDKDSAIAGMLAKSNGDFSLDNLPFGGYRLRISFIGYKTYEQKIFINMQSIEKDLGNVLLEEDATLLKEVTVTTEKSTMELSIDRKVYNVEKDISTRGGTGLDAVKNIPSVTVDADGNVSLRNNSVQIYIDGRPSTLTLQQIPADQIERIEVISNPSVKFDAATTGGILNVILKKNKKPGYNGIIMGGIGTNDRYNGMGNLNVKEGKFNFFAMYNYNTQTNHNDGFTHRNSITLPPPVFGITQKYYDLIDTNSMTNSFQFGRAGFDYSINNRNTITVSGNVVHGEFKTSDIQHYSYSDVSDTLVTKGDRINAQKTQFTSYTGQVQYKRTFPKQGKEFTTDITYSNSHSQYNYLYTTYMYDKTGNSIPTFPTYQKSNGGTPNWMYTYQTDFVNPINEYTKFETGVRSNLSRSFSTQSTANYNDSTGQYVSFSDLTNNYNIINLTNAAYVNYSSKLWGINYQGGLRFEQTYYKGNITNKDLSFSYSYPGNNLKDLQYSLFPAVYFSKKLPHNQEIQLNFSRKINRPNFFQLMPFVMMADNANIRIGNPKLQPEFHNLGELNYNIIYRKLNFLTSLYYRYIQNPITNIAYPEAGNPNILVNTFQNGSNSFVYGSDNTLKLTLFKNLDLTASANIFYTYITWNNATQQFANSGYSYTAKAMITYRLPGDFTLQMNGNYQAPQIIPQGETRVIQYMDVTLNKMLKRKFNFTLQLSDVFNSKRMGTYYGTTDYIQTMSRRRETRYLKFTVTYMFGKMDASIFKRAKQQKGGDNQMEGMGGGF